jgi:hypothetical protein
MKLFSDILCNSHTIYTFKKRSSLKTQCWLFGCLCTVDWRSAQLIFLFNVQTFTLFLNKMDYTLICSE